MKKQLLSAIASISLMPSLLPLTVLAQEYHLTDSPPSKLMAQSNPQEEVQRLFQEAQQLSQQGKYQEAEQKYQQILTIMTEALGAEHPDLAQIYFQLGVMDHKIQKIPSAKEDYENAVRLNPEFLPAIANLGIMVYEEGKIDLAVEYWRSALKIENSVEVQLALAVASYEQGKKTEGINQASEALKQNVKYGDLAFLKEKLWGKTLLKDTKLLLSEQTIQQLIAREIKNQANLSVEGTLDNNSETFDDGSYYQVHTFEGKQGETITIDLISDDFDGYLILVDPDGEKIGENDDGGEGNNARIIITLPQTGTYQVMVNTADTEETGSYGLSKRETTEEDITLAEAEELNQQQNQLYQQGKTAEAIPLAEKALAIRKSFYGNQDHLDVATRSLSDLSGS